MNYIFVFLYTTNQSLVMSLTLLFRFFLFLLRGADVFQPTEPVDVLNESAKEEHRKE